MCVLKLRSGILFQMLQFNQAVKSKDPGVRLTKLKYILRYFFLLLLLLFLLLGLSYLFLPFNNAFFS